MVLAGVRAQLPEDVRAARVVLMSGTLARDDELESELGVEIAGTAFMEHPADIPTAARIVVDNSHCLTAGEFKTPAAQRYLADLVAAVAVKGGAGTIVFVTAEKYWVQDLAGAPSWRSGKARVAE